ncbi:hypothetical protein HMPREF0290_2750 [Corynebacterium efficiens YS-314]|nr:hypothetical protein HMPREF0290_2750 [Corynebacterium efficiens YS-314]
MDLGLFFRHGLPGFLLRGCSSHGGDPTGCVLGALAHHHEV